MEYRSNHESPLWMQRQLFWNPQEIVCCDDVQQKTVEILQV